MENNTVNSITKRKLAYLLLKEVEILFPNAQTELENWKTPFQFLICIMLSAQTTDKQVNKVTSVLFSKYPDPQSLANADIKDILNTIGSINFFNNKGKNILATARILVEKYQGEPPVDLLELQKLPGVGYKTANVFLNDLYQLNHGIAVDTHVLRVARSYGLTKEIEPTKVAHALEKLYKKEDWYKVNTYFVLYGRYILKAKKPDVEKVVLREYLVI